MTSHWIGALHAIVEFARAQPRWPAVVTEHGETITYAELVHLVDARAAGLSLGEAVVIRAKRSVETLLAALASMSCGAIYCPIDPALPQTGFESLQLRLREFVAALVIQRNTAASETTTSTSMPAYVMFTSGSSGTPRGVVVSHGALEQAASSLKDLLELCPSDAHLQFAAMHWDTALEELVATLLSGGTLVFDRRAHSGLHQQFLAAIEQHRITSLNLPTSFWHEFVRFLVENNERVPETLRLIVVGGEALPFAWLREWERLQASHVRLLNTYGSTETVMVTHAAEVAGPRAAPILGNRVPIGRALSHVLQHVASDGELCIGGDAVALCYMGDAAATAERFCPVNVGNQTGRYFRTRDIVEVAEDDSLFYLGRADDQVKIRGIRVTLSALEAALHEHPAVSGAAAIAIDSPTGKTAVGFVTLATPAPDLTPTDLREYLRARVPPYLIVGRIFVVPALRATSTGKVDRNATLRAHQHLLAAAPGEAGC